MNRRETEAWDPRSESEFFTTYFTLNVSFHLK